MMSPKSGENVQAWAAAENSLRSCEYSSYHTVFCVSRCFWGSLSPGGIRSTRRFVTTTKKTTKNPPVVVKISASAEKQTTTHSKRKRKKERQTRSLRESGLVSRGSVFCQNDKQPHTHTSPGSPLSLRRDGGRRRWAGTAPWSTDRTVTPSALTRSLPHRWHATTYHSRALPKMLEKT